MPMNGDYMFSEDRPQSKCYYERREESFPHLLPNGSEERGVLGVESIPVAILPSCQDMKTIAL